MPQQETSNDEVDEAEWRRIVHYAWGCSIPIDQVERSAVITFMRVSKRAMLEIARQKELERLQREEFGRSLERQKIEIMRAV